MAPVLSGSGFIVVCSARSGAQAAPQDASVADARHESQVTAAQSPQRFPFLQKKKITFYNCHKF